jgi:hypothetical protein
MPSAVINGVINGVITWSAFKGHASIPMSMDSIGSPGVTALGNAATVAFTLTFIMTCITFFMFRGAARKSGVAPASLTAIRFLPTGLQIALANTLLALGGFTATAVLWQRFVGTVTVGPVAATLVVAVVATAATAFAETRTKRALLAESAAGLR